MGAERGLQPPNNLPKFVGFVNENGYESQVRGNEDSNTNVFREATRIYQEWSNF